ncbi:MAG: hypothetical protein JNK94_01790 [Hyphomonadaceae bacterium]|nr:hypothetical protein [Hyphomonadaceae bacterium]MBX3509650.1 hypothetical protein [Hyphomonadaceae bacterium]
MRNADGRRDLSLIRASGSTARVLNLALCYERFGDTEDYQNKPMFKNKRLNRALILKHVVRPHERDLFTRPVTSATKVILPYAAKELELGGVSFMVGERRFEKVMRDTVEGYDDEAAFMADAELLRVLGSLPSFDPFLMRERLRHMGVDPSRAYFDLAEADVARMRAFVGKEISQLINLAFATGGREAGDLSQRLAEKLMTDETAKSLDPLRETLRLSGEEYIEGVFAWKGFLYYKWLMAELRPQLEAFRPRFAGLRVSQSTAEERRELAESRREILTQMDMALRRVDETLLQYGEAFAALAEGQPSAFRNFLLRAPSLFIPIGEAVGVVRHIDSFWRFRFPDAATPIMDADETIEVLHEFETTLASTEFVKAPAPAAAA